MRNFKIHNLVDYFLGWPLVSWVLISYLITYILFFIIPTFFSSAQEMQFIQYIPTLTPIGADLQVFRGIGEAWRYGTYSSNYYPPFATAFLYYPLSFLDPTIAYILMTATSFLSLLVVTFIIPISIYKTKDNLALVLLMTITGLYSYGFLFELERGQLNLFAFLLCMVAIYLFHYQNRFRYFAYILISMSIQLKLWPAIFLLMFIQDWRDWRGNIKRLSGITVLNIALLFSLGFRLFVDFLHTVIIPMSGAAYKWVGNHSIKSFMTLLARIISSDFHPGISEQQIRFWGQVILLGMVGFCLLLIIFRVYIKKASGLNPNLLLACTIAALLIPSTSHDYKLCILSAPIAIALYSISSNTYHQKRLLPTLLLFVISLAYSSTLFSYTNKPLFFLQNNLPALMVILMSCTALEWLRDSRSSMSYANS